MKIKMPCKNMNHGRMEKPVNFCPDCGMNFKEKNKMKQCNDFAHANRRKNRAAYCTDCGLKL